MPVEFKWVLIGGVLALTASAAYLMIARGPALLIDLSNGLAGCF